MRALGSAGSTWTRATVVMAAVIAACCLMASSAGAKVVTDKHTGQTFGIVPPPPPPSSLTASRRGVTPPLSGTPTCDSAHVDSHCASPMTLHTYTVGAQSIPGPVQHAENVVLFFWDPNSFSSAPGYVSDMQAWVNGLVAGNYSPGNVASNVGNPVSVAQQYYDFSGPSGAKRFIPLAVRNGGTVMDTDPYPTKLCNDQYTDFYTVGTPTVTLTGCLTEAQLFGELNSYIAAHPSLPRGVNTEYFILTPQNVGTCFDATNADCAIAQYCGWHSYAGSPTNLTGQTVFADMPWLAGTVCDISRGLSYAAGHTVPDLYASGIGSVVGVFSHELSETMTDPNPPYGWFGSGGGSDEIADKCGYQYLVGNLFYNMTGVPATLAGAYYNSTLGAHNYLLQMEFDNRAGGCNQWDTDAQPTGGAISAPAHPATGVPASFSAPGVSDLAGIAYVTWSFGDGATGTSVGTAAINHTYAASGTKAVTAIVTDNHGNELKLTKSVTVAAGSAASVAVHLTNTHPAPNGAYTVKISGLARSGGTLGSTHNRSEVDLFEQTGAICAASRKAEQSKVGAGNALRIGQWFSPAGAFSYSQARKALGSHHATVRFCGYVSRTLAVTDAKSAVASYTTS